MATTSSTPITLLFARLFWMMIGPAILLLTSIQIVSHSAGWFTFADVVFGATVAAMIFAKWIESLGVEARRADGELIQPGDLRRYIIGVIAVGCAAWAIINLVGNHLL